MISYEKIINNAPEKIIEFINLCVSLNEIEALKKWLKECNVEIQRREEAKENTFPLYYEKAYLELILSD